MIRGCHETVGKELLKRMFVRLKSSIAALVLGMRGLIVTTLLVPVFLFLAAPMSAQTQVKPALEARVSIDYSAKIQPLDPVLWPGNEFDKEAATALLKTADTGFHVWKKLPKWQVGAWTTNQATSVRFVKYVDGQPIDAEPQGVYTKKCTCYCGDQKDKYGDVWHEFKSGYWTYAQFDRYTGYSFIRYSAPGSGEYPDQYSESIRFAVDDQTHKIIESSHRRSWVRYVFVAPGLMKEDSVCTVYDETGLPRSTAWETELEKRAASSAEFDSFLNSIASSSQADFVSFLRNNGFEHLIPARSAAPLKTATTGRQYR